MNYKVVPFNPTKNINQDLQSIINENSSSEWEYVSHKYHHYLKPGSDGCFGIGSRPDQIFHVGHVVFKRK